MNKITFELDTPVVVHMMDLAGREYDSRFPPFDSYWTFEAEEGVFYLSDTQGGLFRARLRSRGIAAGEPVTIVKTKVPNPNSDRPIVEYLPYAWAPLEKSA
jgi:hypothetical protein